MSRIKDLRKYIDTELAMISDDDERNAAFIHLNGVALASVILAKKRGLNEELAVMASMLHDLYAYRSGSYDDHAHKGAEYARNILEKLNITSSEETDIICSAIYHHDDKAVTDGPVEELLKDADVISHTMHDPLKPIKEKEQARYDRICSELGLR